MRLFSICQKVVSSLSPTLLLIRSLGKNSPGNVGKQNRAELCQAQFKLRLAKTALPSQPAMRNLSGQA